MTKSLGNVSASLDLKGGGRRNAGLILFQVADHLAAGLAWASSRERIRKGAPLLIQNIPCFVAGFSLRLDMSAVTQPPSGTKAL